jgi:hypothetical protein
VLILATVVVLALFLAADLSRPATSQTHLGRAVRSGDLLDDINRKARRAAATVSQPLALVIVVGGLALARVRPRLRHLPAWRAAAWALLVAAVIGSAVNDSGLLVGAAVTAVGWPALLVVDAVRPTAEEAV